MSVTVTVTNMVTILEDGVDSVQDICASLGLGEVPLLNAENRELNRQLQELQVVITVRKPNKLVLL